MPFSGPTLPFSRPDAPNECQLLEGTSGRGRGFQGACADAGPTDRTASIAPDMAILEFRAAAFALSSLSLADRTASASFATVLLLSLIAQSSG
jgi:hypothetical protein